MRQVSAKRSGPTIWTMLLDLGDPVAGVVECLAAAGGGEDELGPLVGAVGPAFQVAEILQVADQLGGGGQAQLGAGGQVGEPDAVHAEVAEDVQVRFAQVGVAMPGRGLEQLGAELPEQPDQQLADGEPVGRQIP